MHASLQGSSLPVVLHDHPPVDKPDRLPLRQGWSTAGDEPAAGVQPETSPGLPRAPRYRVRTEGGAGIIHAVNERALRDARRAVRSAHRQPVAFEPPTVHRYRDTERQLELEPLMFVRVNARRAHLTVLVDDLRRRGARLQEVELQQQRVVIRAEARLASILGLEAAIHEATDNTAQVATWLVRYEAVGSWHHEGAATAVSAIGLEGD